MTDDQLQAIKEVLAIEREHSTRVIQEAIKTTVNGNIRRLDEKLERHMEADKIFKENIEPFLQGIKGLKVLRSTAIWMAITVTTVGSAILMWKQLIK